MALKITSLLILCLFMSGCSTQQPHSTTSESTYSQNIDSLKNFIDLKTYVPVNVMWKLTTMVQQTNNARLTVPGPTDYKLEAYLQFSRATANKLKNTSVGNRVIATNDYWFSWLPKELLLKERCDSSSVYEAKPFASAPYLTGSYVFISPNVILINLSTN